MGSRGRSSNSSSRGGGSFRSSGSRSFGSSSGYRSSRSYSPSRSYSYGHNYRSSSSNSLGFLFGLLMGRDHSLDRDSNSSTNSVSEIPKYKKVKNKKATAITSAIFGVLTIVSIILSVCAVSISFGKVMGTVEKVYSRKIFNETYYYTSYEYVVDSQTYYAESQTGWTMLPDPIHIYMGSQYELYYKKSNPYIIYEIEDKENLPTLKPVFLAFAFILGITTICILVIGVGKYQLNPEWVQAQKIAEDKEKMQGKKRCEYCASIMDENLNKCTSCGAPLK